jgi:hypothetical protein
MTNKNNKLTTEDLKKLKGGAKNEAAGSTYKVEDRRESNGRRNRNKYGTNDKDVLQSLG